MFIVPMSDSITPLNILSQNEPTIVYLDRKPSFTDVFREVLNETQETQKVLDRNAADIIMGDIDDLHTIYNNITKARISLETFVAIRDAAQASYKEIMQMQI